MSRKKSGVNWSMSIPQRRRRQTALNRLTNQLTSGVKTVTVEGITKTVDLTPKDVKRIQNEISILKKRI